MIAVLVVAKIRGFGSLANWLSVFRYDAAAANIGPIGLPTVYNVDEEVVKSIGCTIRR